MPELALQLSVAAWAGEASQTGVKPMATAVRPRRRRGRTDMASSGRDGDGVERAAEPTGLQPRSASGPCHSIGGFALSGVEC
ncbi:hypothetical protein GCM10011584_28140 [Nocardioides phosphati]|uniref:Uncharacterized protein n=1 Tax=Nocardioides phosphati TaxID=1867775 RepID=A0ABQ2NDA2_9ACTN|nr:hypothetical protein GCM10011584_28140 [Nocardioides phosphati]